MRGLSHEAGLGEVRQEWHGFAWFDVAWQAGQVTACFGVACQGSSRQQRQGMASEKGSARSGADWQAGHRAVRLVADRRGPVRQVWPGKGRNEGLGGARQACSGWAQQRSAG